MKRILIILLIFAMVFVAAGCGSKDDGQGTEPGTDTSLDGMNGEGNEGEGADSENSDISDIDEKDYTSDVSEADFDFKFEASESFGLSSILDKVSYKDLSSLGSSLESNLKSGIASSIGGEYDIFSDYETDDADEIDKIVYAIGMENGDTEGEYIESGVYHKTSGGYNQYITFATANYYKNSQDDIASIKKLLKDGMGITVSNARLSKAVEIALSKATEKQDYYSLYDSQTIKGDGYTETVKLTVDGFATEDNQIGYYVSVDRDRKYN